jgi:hypothetical protein
MVAYAFGAGSSDIPPNPRWHPNLDINDDEFIDIVDVALVAYEYGKIDP